jgi:peptidylprolyl isomerase
MLSVALALSAVGIAPAGAASGPLAKVRVSGDVTTKPQIDFDAPFAVKKSVDSVVTEGGGEQLAAGQTVTFDFLLVDARNGKEVQTSYGASPASLVLDKKKTTKQLVDSLTGVKVGTRVLLAIAPKDGLAKRLSASKVKKDDTLLFVVDVKGARSPLTRATGEAVAPVDGLPTVALSADGKPTISVPSGAAAPTDLVVQPLIKGAGAQVQSGETVSVQYTGVIWATGKQFDSSWDKGTPLETVIGIGNVIAGWDQGLVTQTVGSQVLLIVPPAKGYGDKGQSSAGISGTDTLVFVVDILDAY